MQRVLLCALVLVAAIVAPVGSALAEKSMATVPTNECNASNYTSRAPDGQEAYGAHYIVENDVWNPVSIQQKLVSCNFNSFYVEANVKNSAGAVQSYPSSQYTFASPIDISRFSSLSSAFRFSDPPTGSGLDYEAAYDLWIDGYGGNDHTELMIWTYTDGQRPFGKELAATISIGGHSYRVWKGGTLGDGGTLVTFETTHNYTSGETNLLSFLDYAATHGWLFKGTATPLWQVDYGAELCATSGLTKFDFTDFNVKFGT
jgi:Glycosyl hydrolase family 12